MKRYAKVTGLKPDCVSEYKKIHAAVWPDVLKTIKACHIQNYSINLKEIDKRHFLFSYFEYTGDNFEKDMEKMAADSSTREWWRITDGTQIPLADAAEKGETWSDMEEVFYLK